MSYYDYMNIYTDICPHCEKSTKYFPSPYYLHLCKNCEKWCSQSELKKGIIVEVAHKVIQEKKDEIEQIERNLKEKINIYEEKKKDTKFNRFDIMEI